MRRAGARLVHVDDELIAELAGEHFVGRGHDGMADVAGQVIRGRVGRRRRFLDEDGGRHELVGCAKAADRKVLGGALGLDPVVRVGRNVVLAQRIALAANVALGVRFHLST